MSDVMTGQRTAKWKQSVVRTLAGALAGASAMTAVLAVAGLDFLAAMGPSRVALASVGLIYAMMAAFVGFGLAAPRVGAALLNVADAEELREERRGMAQSMLVCGGFGLTLILLAIARGPAFPAGAVPGGLAMAALAVLLIASAVLSWRGWGRFDELSRLLGLEGCMWGFCLSWMILTPWAAADFLGWGLRLTPIDVVTTLSAMILLGAFVAIGRRGMMTR